jgi:hypothetical protein
MNSVMDTSVKHESMLYRHNCSEVAYDTRGVVVPVLAARCHYSRPAFECNIAGCVIHK